MNNDRIIELLEEIRDLQRRHATNQEEAIRNQQESIERQRGAIQYQRQLARRLLLVMIPLAATIVLLGAWLGLQFI